MSLRTKMKNMRIPLQSDKIAELKAKFGCRRTGSRKRLAVVVEDEGPVCKKRPKPQVNNMNHIKITEEIDGKTYWYRYRCENCHSFIDFTEYLSSNDAETDDTFMYSRQIT